MRSIFRMVCLFLIHAAWLPLASGQTIITFEDLVTTGPGTGGQVAVTNQYASLGVTFNFPSALDYSKGLAIPNFAHSGNIAIEQCYAAEFCFVPITMQFTAGQNRVKVWVGASFPLNQSATVYMKGYNAAGTEITSNTVVLPARTTGPTLIRFPLEIGRFASDIRKVDVGFAPAGTATNNGLAIDDVEFETVGPPPPCPSTVPPTLTLNSPTNGTVTRCNRMLFRDTVASADPFARRIVTVRGPSMGQQKTWTTNLMGSSGTTTYLYDMLFPGVNTVSDRIEDCRGAVERSATVTYDPVPEGVQLTVLGFEPTQSVQTMPNSVPLLTNKRTVVRVYVRLDGPLTSLAGVRGRLAAFRPGLNPQFQLGPSLEPNSVQSVNTITAVNTMDLPTARRDVNASLNFEIPASWTQPGQVHFQLSTLTLEGCDERLDVVGGDNLLPVGYLAYNTFTEAPPVRLRLVDVVYRTTAGGTMISPRAEDKNLLESWLRRAYPTGQVQSRRLTLAARVGTPGTTFNADDINNQLQDIRSMEVSNGSVDRRTHYYGLVSDSAGFMRGKADGIPSWVASGPAGSGTFGWDNDGSYADWYGGHELGHTFGRHHAVFCGAQACTEFIWTFCPEGYVAYPFGGGFLDSNTTHGNFGFDVGDPSLSLPMRVYRPDVAHDVMTYCDNEWMSDFTYMGILNRLRAENPAGEAETSQAPIAQALLLSANLNLTQETAQLRPFWRMPNLEGSDRPTVSHYSIQLRDASNNTLVTYLFAPKVDTETMEGEDFRGSMSEVVPWVDGTRRIVILRDDIEMASRTVSNAAPTVQVTSPNGGENLTGATAVVSWTASDADGQPMTYALHYSKNNGQTWQVVDTGIQTTTYTVDLDTIPGSTQALFRVYATDGVNTGVDTSNATFTVRKKLPDVTILSPAAGSQYTNLDTVILSGEASDLEDGFLAGSSMQWFSNVDGPLGAGSAITRNLKPGKHTITLSAADGDGGIGQASIEVVVNAVAPVPRPGEDRNVIVGSAVLLDGSASQGVPTLKYLWEIVSQPDGSAAVVNQADTATPSFTPARPGRYVVQLTITDGTNATAVAQVVYVATGAANALRIAGGLAASTNGDMASLNVEKGGVSSTVIDIVDALRIIKRGQASQSGGGVITVTLANQYGGVAVGRGYGAVIDDPRLNGRPDLRVIATHQFVGAYGHPLSVGFDVTLQKWVVTNEDQSIMTLGEKINYFFSPDIGAVTKGSAGGPFAWGVYLDDPRLNFNAAAIPLAIHNPSGARGETLGVWYNGSKWVAYHETGASIPNTERFFWYDAGSAGGKAVRSAGNAYSTYGVYLNDARVNNNSGAIILVQHAGQASYNPSPVGIWYDGSRWVAYNEDRTPMGNAEAVHYLVVQP